MSIQGIGSTSLPVVNDAAMPAEVRNGDDKQKQAYASALGFERMLVEQLTKSLAQNAMGSSSDDSNSEDGTSTDSGASMYSDMVSGSLADSIASQGGLGLANGLYQSLGMEGK